MKALNLAKAVMPKFKLSKEELSTGKVWGEIKIVVSAPESQVQDVILTAVGNLVMPRI